MILLAIRTDKPEAELYVYDDASELATVKWEAHRQLANTIHSKIEALLKACNKDWHDINGVIVFAGPGSFTGLRIGISVANTIAYSLSIPIIGATEDAWLKDGVTRLLAGESSVIVVPEYGAEANITLPKK